MWYQKLMNWKVILGALVVIGGFAYIGNRGGNSQYASQVKPYLNQLNAINTEYNQDRKDAANGAIGSLQMATDLSQLSSKVNKINSDVQSIQPPANMQSAQNHFETCVTDYQDALLMFESSFQTGESSKIAQGNQLMQSAINELKTFRKLSGI